MGYGDKIMLTGWIRERGKRRKVHPYSDIYLGNPLIGDDGEPLRYKDWMAEHGYNPKMIGWKWKYAPFRAIRGDIFLTREEREWAKQFGEGFIIAEPNLKGMVGGSNRDWGFDKWLALSERIPMIQMSGERRLPCRHIDTPTFRHACAVLERAAGIVTTNGGLHHAAAALRKPAVVIWGGYNSPNMLGYSDHFNLYEPSTDCEGRQKPCTACRECMDKITVDRVLENVRRMIS